MPGGAVMARCEGLLHMIIESIIFRHAEMIPR